MKIHNFGKFHQFCVPIQHPQNGPFWNFFGTLLPQIWSNIAEILTSTLANKNIVSKIYEGFEFLWKRDGPKVSTFGSTLSPCFPLKMAENEQKQALVWKNFSHWAIQICQYFPTFSSFTAIDHKTFQKSFNLDFQV